MVCILRGAIAPNWTVAKEMMGAMTFKMELMLMDPLQVKASLIKRVISILNQNQNLTPELVKHYSEGAALLFVWVINFVKWNIGHKKFQFDEATLAGQKDLNRALVPLNTEDNGVDEDEELKQLKRANAYGLMTKSPNKQPKKKKKKHQAPVAKGTFVPSKQMIFSDKKELIPQTELKIVNSGTIGA